VVRAERVRVLKGGEPGPGPVIYWMSRDQRVRDNWALLYAQQCAVERRAPLSVVFCLVPSFLGATMRHYGFMLKGLAEVETRLRESAIPFFLLVGDPPERISGFAHTMGAGLIVTDFDPLRIKRDWKRQVARKVDTALHEVDAHNIVPCWIASPKQEYGAYTLRPKIRKALPQFLERFPALKVHPFPWKGKVTIVDWHNERRRVRADRSVGEVAWAVPGEDAARKALRAFVSGKLGSYAEVRNDPSRDGQSNLSPYLHFGQLSAQRVALDVLGSSGAQTSREAYLEELIVRRELADNFCFYSGHYDSFEGFPEWAKQSLLKHLRDRREFVYTLEEFEAAKTHDDLWNAAQIEMVTRGKMHGYMRMYWAKKILQWTESPEQAMAVAVYLNDRYELDGRDPNGYAGIAWSIGGVHDRAWPERPIFGKVRYMSYDGCRSKFDVKAYIDYVSRF
jgi:deoxyribodipyrimidine photo-lyase